MPSFTPPAADAVDFDLASFTVPAADAVDFQVGSLTGPVLTQPVGQTDADGVPATSGGSFVSDEAALERFTCAIDGVTLDDVVVITVR